MLSKGMVVVGVKARTSTAAKLDGVGMLIRGRLTFRQTRRATEQQEEVNVAYPPPKISPLSTPQGRGVDMAGSLVLIHRDQQRVRIERRIYSSARIFP